MRMPDLRRSLLWLKKKATSQAGFNEKILPTVGKFANTRFVRAVMGAGYSIIAFTIVGSMFLILSVLTQVITFPSFVDFYNSTLGRFNNLFTVIYNATMGIIALFFTGSFAYNYTKIYQQEENLDLSPLNGAFLSFFALFITVPQLVWKNGSAQFLTDAKNAVYSGYAISGSGLSRIGATGIFTGLIIGTLAIQIYRLCIKKGWSIKMPNSVPKGVSDSFTSLIPCFIIAVVVLLIDAVLIMCHTDIFNLLYIPFSFVSGLVDSWWGILIIVFLIHFLWFFGIHGQQSLRASRTHSFWQTWLQMFPVVSMSLPVTSSTLSSRSVVQVLRLVQFCTWLSCPSLTNCVNSAKWQSFLAFSTSTSLCSSVCRSSTILIWSFRSFWHQWQVPWSATLQLQRTSFQKLLPNNHGRRQLV